MAAPTRSCFRPSLEAAGCSRFFFRSVRAISATSSSRLLTIGSFPFLLRCRISLASLRVTPAGATTRSLRLVITSARGVALSRSRRKSMSREVTMPSSRPPRRPEWVTGTPEKPSRALASHTSPTVCAGLITSGSVMKPCSNRLTLRTSLAWNSGVQLWWMMPMPPFSTSSAVKSM